MDQRLIDIWEAERPRLVNIAYRMLGSRHDAEDVVQETYLRLQSADREAIRDPVGWLLTVTGRLCIDQLRSARKQRETYIGPWLPEPLIQELNDPIDQITLDDSVRLALMIVLEQLSPAERASYILHEVFQIPFSEVAEIVGRTPQACRQLASRARQRIAASAPPRFEIEPGIAKEITSRFAQACQTGDLDMLVDLLDPQVEGLFDSGGHIPGAPAGLVTGAENVAQRLATVFANADVQLIPEPINGEPGVLVISDNKLVSVIALELADARITRIHGIGNPDKLTGLRAPQP